ncbi:WbqC family protein [Campylobacter lanienae]|uniref:WbqC family protein n=1 Tax=Campylobacter lanienae TaxID=75658 RepID=UPI000BB40BCE|nr:WbqC family protein [Campylobacter lanienae]
MSKKVAILQSNYIPWKGYFDIIASVDEFIFYDEMQYTKNDWRNRNKIKTPNGLHWLSIPVATKGHLSQDVRIMDAKIVDKKWANSHWNTIKQFYIKTPYFNDYSDIFEKIYKECKQEEYLCKVNYKFIYAINEILRIKTKISFSQDYGLIDGKTERLVDLVQKASGTEYLSGPAAKDYIDEKLFKEANIKLSWMDYSNYPEYPQFYPPFEHGVSILDLIFNCGPEARKYMKG